jgi:hypothetical protein
MASILAARKLANYDADNRVPATMCAIADAVKWAEEIMKEIDRRGLRGSKNDATRIYAESQTVEAKVSIP